MQTTPSQTTRRIQQELKQVIKKTEATTGSETGILVKVGDDITRWWIAFGAFEYSTPLGKDLVQLGRDHVLAQVTFGADYPLSPPFVRVVSPRLTFHSGHVTVGGSICTELLVNTGSPGGWNPTYSMENVLITVRQLLIDGKASVDFFKTRQYGSYEEDEARAAYTRVASTHGWNQSPNPSPLLALPAAQAVSHVTTTVFASPSPPAFPSPLISPRSRPLTCTPHSPTLVVARSPLSHVKIPENWQMTSEAYLCVSLPAFDPQDGGLGTRNYLEAVEVASKFHQEWTSPGRPTITSITRIEHRTRYAAFEMKRQMMAYTNGENCVNAKILFHGTKARNVTVISEQGLDMRESADGFLGMGIYFAERSSMADSYTSSDAANSRVIFLCMVLLGEAEQIASASRGQGRRKPSSRDHMHAHQKSWSKCPYDSISSIYPGTQDPYHCLFENDSVYCGYQINYL